MKNATGEFEWVGEKNISKKKHPHRDLSTSLRFGRDDKGERGASRESGC
jgi:hypothetical protein